MVIWTLQKSTLSFTAGSPETAFPPLQPHTQTLVSAFGHRHGCFLHARLPGLEAVNQVKLLACSKPSTFARHKVRLEEMESWIRLLSFHPAPLPPLLTGYCFGHKQFRCTFGPTQDGHFYSVFASRLQYMPTYFKHSSTISAKIHW